MEWCSSHVDSSGFHPENRKYSNPPPPTFAKECPKGHALEDYVEDENGACDGCGKPIQAGDRVMDCRICNWYLCKPCYSAHGGDGFDCFDKTWYPDKVHMGA